MITLSASYACGFVTGLAFAVVVTALHNGRRPW